MGEIFVLKPGAAGAIGRARWRNSSESIAMMKMFLRVAWCSARVEGYEEEVGRISGC